MIRKTIAFTLAETLIVMGIIGIVSALTLPNLNASTGEKEKVAKVKKLYQNLDDAYGRATAVYGPINEWFLNDTTETAQKTRFMERMTEFMKVSKKVNSTTYILADGTEISTYYFSQSEGYNIRIDIDGPNKGKNRDGVDGFYFRIMPNNNTLEPRYYANLLTSCPEGDGCTKWVIEYDNMDYLKLNSQGKCPNGKVLNATATPPVVSCN